MLQLPSDCHGFLANVAAIDSGSEKPEGPFVSSEAGEEHDRSSVSLVVPIAAARGAVRSCRRLALPVDECAAHRVVAVACRGREPPAALVECERKQLGACVPGFIDAALPGGDLRAGAEPYRSEDLDAAVAAVDQ